MLNLFFPVLPMLKISVSVVATEQDEARRKQCLFTPLRWFPENDYLSSQQMIQLEGRRTRRTSPRFPYGLRVDLKVKMSRLYNSTPVSTWSAQFTTEFHPVAEH